MAPPPRKLLTKRRAGWVRGRQHDGKMRGTRLAYPAGVMERYRMRLQNLTDQMTKTCQKEMERLFRHPDFGNYLAEFTSHQQVAMDISPASQARILANDLERRFEQMFQSAAKPHAEQMVDEANDASASATYESLKKLSGGLSLDVKSLTPALTETMKAAVALNVSLIKSVPSEFFTDMKGAVLRSITDGKGLEDLTKFFEDQHGVQSRRAKNIALDQTRKTYNALNKGRMQQNGVHKFEWLHSGGGLHPRPLHQSYNGRVFSFTKLPVIDDATGETGIPGQAINCGCTMVPVIEFQQGEPK